MRRSSVQQKPNRIMRSTEVVITEKKQDNSADSNISLDNIYNAIRYLKPEHQGVILANYKLTELYNIFSDDENYKKYLDDLYSVANGYIDRVVALSALHTEAFLQSIKKQEEFNPVDTMCKMFDCMSEADQKRFCESMFQKKDFFEDAYMSMISVLENAVKSNEIVEKNTVKE